ncbi:enoyl-CoA hydratase/isomerase family protein [Aneurinibacillus sp. BA2021]|nr:enoyl-CoA hydratase/isomerase family protein [Aneurinibacillus sp. BA2021]
MRIMITRAPGGKITLQETSHIAIVTIKRPHAYNALTAKMWKDLKRVACEIKERKKTRVVILRGVPGQFSAGADLKEFTAMTHKEVNKVFSLMEEAIAAFESLPMPVICAMDGPALGAGFVLSLACDMRIGTENTRLGIPVGRLGITLGPSFVRRIVRVIGQSRTKELVYTNRLYEPEEAMQLGLLNTVIKQAEMDVYMLDLAQRIAKQSPRSLQAVKQAVHLCEWKNEIPWMYADPVDFAEGCLAFAEKRPPQFS